ncbi:MAG: NADP-dependent phosphogluconate dehydrogenase [Burkholderiales bacterium]|nr:NADP-dependent phosphogluconate dehydrogenase [Burkholderiales bacterium]
MQRMNDIGIIGLGVMGENLALNFERNGFGVAGFDTDAAKRASFAVRMEGRRGAVAGDFGAFADALVRPRRVLVMVPAGSAVDDVIAALRPHLGAGDILIDGGNSHFADTARRIGALQDTGVLYVGCGVSGGEEGALHGPALMPGGDAAAWPHLAPQLRAIAAKADDGTPCCDWVGAGGSGHFVKMVHNGIEYGDMQAICEAYWLMRELFGMPAPAIGAVFTDWNRGELASYLVQITADILAHADPETGRALVDLVLDTAEQKGTGKWASQSALDLGVTAPAMASAVFARTLSAAKLERVAASPVLAGPPRTFAGDRSEWIGRLRRALFVTKVCCYAQGLQLLRAASKEHGWDLRLGSIVSLWRAGCIIRAKLLDPVRGAYARNPELVNLLVDERFAALLSDYQQDLREVVAIAALHGVAVPAFMNALAYYDGYRSGTLPANLLQAQRDYFGAHGYRRVDRPGKFHTQWN